MTVEPGILIRDFKGICMYKIYIRVVMKKGSMCVISKVIVM